MTVLLHTNVMGQRRADPVVMAKGRFRLSALVAEHAPKDRPFIVSVHRGNDIVKPRDHNVKLRATWSTTMVGPKDVVLIVALPMGGGGGGGGAANGKNIAMALAMLALVVAVPWAIGALGAPFAAAAGGLTFLGKAVSAGIIIGASYLISKATQPAANPNESSRPLYTVGGAGGGNLPRPGDRIPVGYGEFWTQPDLSQPDYFAYDGEDMVLYRRMTLGLGEYQVLEITVGETPFWTLEDGVLPPFNVASPGSNGSASASQVEVILPGATSALVPSNVFSSGAVSGAELPRPADFPSFTGPFAAMAAGKPGEVIQLDYSLPNGCFRQSGTIEGRWSWGVRFEAALCDDDDQPIGGYFALLDVQQDNVKITRGQRFTVHVPVTSGRYVVRAQNKINDSVLEDEPATNTVTWDGLRAFYPETVVRPHVTELALKIRSSKATANASFNQVWVKCRRVLPIWNGSSWVNGTSSKAIYAYRDILRATYGASLSEGEVDDEVIKFYRSELAAFDSFDGMIRGPVSVYEAAAVVLGAIRAEPTRIGNLWSIQRDEQKAVRKHKFTRRQMVRGSSSLKFDIDRSNGECDIIVEYNPDSDPRRRRDFRVTFGAQALTPKRQKAAGVATYEQAYALAVWQAAAAFYRRERYRFTAELQGRMVKRGDVADIDLWFVSEGVAAGVMSHDGLTLTLDTDVVADGSTTYAAFRDRRGRYWGPILCSQGSAANIIELDADDVAAAETESDVDYEDMLANDNEDMTSVTIGPLDLKTYIIESAIPRSDRQVEIEAVLDDEGVWNALGEDIPVGPSIPSMGDMYDPGEAKVPWVKARCSQKGVTLVMEWSCGSARGATAYIVKLSYDDGATWEEVSAGPYTAGEYTIHFNDQREDKTCKVVAYAMNTRGVPGTAVYSTFVTFRPRIDDSVADIEIKLQNFSEQLRQLLHGYQREAKSAIQATTDETGRLIAELAAQTSLAGETLVRQIRRAEGRTAAAFNEAIRVATGPDSAIAEQITELQAQVNDEVATAIATVNQTVSALAQEVDGELEAIAAVQTSLSAAVGQHTAQLNTRFVVGTGPAGSLVAYELHATAEQARTGFKVVAIQQGATRLGYIFMDADRVFIGKEGAGGFSPLFIFDTSLGRYAVNGDIVATGTISASKMAVGQLSAITANLGLVTAGRMVSNSGLFDVNLDGGYILISDG